MSGDGDDKKKAEDKKTAEEGYYPGGPKGATMTVQPAMPGQLESIAAQLAAAYGQSPQGLLAHMQQYYQPMTLPSYAPAPATPAATGGTTPTQTGGGGSSASGGSVIDRLRAQQSGNLQGILGGAFHGGM